jgi:hypothetical protein
LSRRVASLAVIRRPVALKVEAKPRRAKLRPAEVATLSWPPPTLAISGSRLVLTVRWRRMTRRGPWARIRLPCPSKASLAASGSTWPPASGRVSAEPWRLAGAVALRVTPWLASSFKSPLSRVIVVVAEPRGS